MTFDCMLCVCLFVIVIWLAIINMDNILRLIGAKSRSVYDGGADGASLQQSSQASSPQPPLTTGAGSPSTVAANAYEQILGYVGEVGGSADIEKYLMGLLNTPKVEITEYTKSQRVLYPKLFELLMTAAIRTGADSAGELITMLDIRYIWFVPDGKRALLLNSYKYDLGLTSELRAKIRATAPTFNAVQIDKLADKLATTSRSYYKFKSNWAKKPASVIAKAKGDAFELDHVGVEAPIKYLLGCAQGDPKFSDAKSIDDRLRDIDLIMLYPKDPLAVRNFIERVERDARALSKQQSYGLGSGLVGDLLRDLNFERDRETREQREREARDREARERADMQRAIDASRFTYDMDKIKRGLQPPTQYTPTSKPLPDLVIPPFRGNSTPEKIRRLSSPM